MIIHVIAMMHPGAIHMVENPEDYLQQVMDLSTSTLSEIIPKLPDQPFAPYDHLTREVVAALQLTLPVTGLKFSARFENAGLVNVTVEPEVYVHATSTALH